MFYKVSIKTQEWILFWSQTNTQKIVSTLTLAFFRHFCRFFQKSSQDYMIFEFMKDLINWIQEKKQPKISTKKLKNVYKGPKSVSQNNLHILTWSKFKEIFVMLSDFWETLVPTTFIELLTI